jgi:NADPH:quinone reductase
VLGKIARLELWGTGRAEHASLIRELGATAIDYQREDFTRLVPGGFDVVFDGVGENGYSRSFAALKRGGLLCAYGYSAGVQEQHRMLTMLMWIGRLYLWRWLPGGKRTRFYSINVRISCGRSDAMARAGREPLRYCFSDMRAQSHVQLAGREAERNQCQA